MDDVLVDGVGVFVIFFFLGLVWCLIILRLWIRGCIILVGRKGDLVISGGKFMDWFLFEFDVFLGI